MLSAITSVPLFVMAVLPLTLSPLFLSFSSFPLHLSSLFQYWTLLLLLALLLLLLFFLSASSSSSAAVLRRQPHFPEWLFILIPLPRLSPLLSLFFHLPPSSTHLFHISFLGNSLREVGAINWKRFFIHKFF